MPVKNRRSSLLSHCFAMAALLICVLPANASIVLYGTRVIFSGDETEATLKISNEGKLPSLVQSWLDTGDGDMAPEGIDVPFVIAPSLTRLEASDQQMLRIIHSGQPLIQDRESLFWINVLDVPPKTENAKGSQGSLALAFRTRIKLIYRPKGLPGEPKDAPEQLQWSASTTRDGQAVLQARNPTAYVANLGHIAVEAAGQSFKMNVGHVLPGETAKFAFQKPAENEQLPKELPADAVVVYTSLNDWGGAEGHRVELGRRR